MRSKRVVSLLLFLIYSENRSGSSVNTEIEIRIVVAAFVFLGLSNIYSNNMHPLWCASKLIHAIITIRPGHTNGSAVKLYYNASDTFPPGKKQKTRFYAYLL